MALPGAGEDSGEEQKGDQRQQDGQHQHRSCRTADRTGREDPSRLGGGQLRKSSPVLRPPRQKRGSSFPLPVPQQFLKEELEKLPSGYREGTLSLTTGGLPDSQQKLCRGWRCSGWVRVATGTGGSLVGEDRHLQGLKVGVGSNKGGWGVCKQTQATG